MNTVFSVGNVLSTGFRMWSRNVVPFLLITALIYSPLILWTVVSTMEETTIDNILSVWKAHTRIVALAAVMNILVSAALTYGVVMELQGRHATIGECIGTGVKRFLPALGVTILTFLCVGGGMLLLIIPGIIFYCMLFVAPQVAVLERQDLGGSLGRSRDLTRGHRWQIFGLLFVLTIINFSLSKLVESLVLPGEVNPETIQRLIENMPRYMYIDLFREMIFSSLTAVMASVAYYFLRAEKEGTTVDELAAVFD